MSNPITDDELDAACSREPGKVRTVHVVPPSGGARPDPRWTPPGSLLFDRATREVLVCVRASWHALGSLSALGRSRPARVSWAPGGERPAADSVPAGHVFYKVGYGKFNIRTGTDRPRWSSDYELTTTYVDPGVVASPARFVGCGPKDAAPDPATLTESALWFHADGFAVCVGGAWQEHGEPRSTADAERYRTQFGVVLGTPMAGPIAADVVTSGTIAYHPAAGALYRATPDGGGLAWARVAPGWHHRPVLPPPAPGRSARLTAARTWSSVERRVELGRRADAELPVVGLRRDGDLFLVPDAAAPYGWRAHVLAAGTWQSAAELEARHGLWLGVDPPSPETVAAGFVWLRPDAREIFQVVGAGSSAAHWEGRGLGASCGPTIADGNAFRGPTSVDSDAFRPADVAPAAWQYRCTTLCAWRPATTSRFVGVVADLLAAPSAGNVADDSVAIVPGTAPTVYRAQGHRWLRVAPEACAAIGVWIGRGDVALALAPTPQLVCYDPARPDAVEVVQRVDGAVRLVAVPDAYGWSDVRNQRLRQRSDVMPESRRRNEAHAWRMDSVGYRFVGLVDALTAAPAAGSVPATSVCLVRQGDAVAVYQVVDGAWTPLHPGQPCESVGVAAASLGLSASSVSDGFVYLDAARSGEVRVASGSRWVPVPQAYGWSDLPDAATAATRVPLAPPVADPAPSTPTPTPTPTWRSDVHGHERFVGIAAHAGAAPRASHVPDDSLLLVVPDAARPAEFEVHKVIGTRWLRVPADLYADVGLYVGERPLGLGFDPTALPAGTVHYNVGPSSPGLPRLATVAAADANHGNRAWRVVADDWDWACDAAERVDSRWEILAPDAAARRLPPVPADVCRWYPPTDGPRRFAGVVASLDAAPAACDLPNQSLLLVVADATRPHDVAAYRVTGVRWVPVAPDEYATYGLWVAEVAPPTGALPRGFVHYRPSSGVMLAVTGYEGEAVTWRQVDDAYGWVRRPEDAGGPWSFTPRAAPHPLASPPVPVTSNPLSAWSGQRYRFAGVGQALADAPRAASVPDRSLFLVAPDPGFPEIFTAYAALGCDWHALDATQHAAHGLAVDAGLLDARDVALGCVIYDTQSSCAGRLDATHDASGDQSRPCPIWSPVPDNFGWTDGTAPAGRRPWQLQSNPTETTMANATTTTTTGTTTTAQDAPAKPSLMERPFVVAATRDATDAGWRVAALQLTKLARDPLAAAIGRRVAADDDSIRATIAEFLKTDAGTALLQGLIGMALTAAPDIAGEATARLAREMRVGALTTGGDLIAELVTDPLRQLLANRPEVLAGLIEVKPAGLADGARPAGTTEGRVVDMAPARKTTSG